MFLYVLELFFFFVLTFQAELYSVCKKLNQMLFF